MSEKQTKAKQKEKSDKLVKVEKEISILPKCRLTKTSLELDESISDEDFVKIGITLWKMKGAVLFWLGDWCLFYKDPSSSLRGAGSLVSAVYSIRTVKNAVWVCHKIEPSRRRENLSFGHHQVVAPLPPEDQDKWLEIAEWNRYSVKLLRNEIKRAKVESKTNKNGDDSGLVTYEGDYYLYENFLKFCIPDIEKFIKKLHALNSLKVYAKYSHLLNPEYARRDTVEGKFIESGLVLLDKLEYLLEKFKESYIGY